MTPPTTNPAAAQTEEKPKHIDAKFDQNDAKLRASVAEFVESTGGAAAAPKERIEVKPDESVGMPSPYDIMLTEALVDTQKVDVSDEEKALFVKAVLNDEPIRLTIKLLNDQFSVRLRSRSSHEQRRIFDVLNDDTKKGMFAVHNNEGVVVATDMAYNVTRMQQYCTALMVERVNDVIFSELKLDPKDTIEQSRDKLHAVVDEKIEGMHSLRWTAISNAMRIFEVKCAKLGTEAANQDFWKPRG